MRFIILMQSEFLYRGHCVGIGTGDFYSYNEIILIYRQYSYGERGLYMRKR